MHPAILVIDFTDGFRAGATSEAPKGEKDIENPKSTHGFRYASQRYLPYEKEVVINRDCRVFHPYRSHVLFNQFIVVLPFFSVMSGIVDKWRDCTQ